MILYEARGASAKHCIDFVDGHPMRHNASFVNTCRHLVTVHWCLKGRGECGGNRLDYADDGYYSRASTIVGPGQGANYTQVGGRPENRGSVSWAACVGAPELGGKSIMETDESGDYRCRAWEHLYP